jgi:hypothetical protein
LFNFIYIYKFIKIYFVLIFINLINTIRYRDALWWFAFSVLGLLSVTFVCLSLFRCLCGSRSDSRVLVVIGKRVKEKKHSHVISWFLFIYDILLIRLGGGGLYVRANLWLWFLGPASRYRRLWPDTVVDGGREEKCWVHPAAGQYWRVVISVRNRRNVGYNQLYFRRNSLGRRTIIRWRGESYQYTVEAAITREELWLRRRSYNYERKNYNYVW